jgi:hypothetical protein
MRRIKHTRRHSNIVERIIRLESDVSVPLKISLPFLSRQVKVRTHRIS